MKTLLLIFILFTGAIAQEVQPCDEQLKAALAQLAEANAQIAVLKAKPKKSKWAHIQDILERLGIGAAAIAIGKRL